MRQQSGRREATRNRFGRQRRLARLNILALLFAGSAEVGRPHRGADEDLRRLIIVAFGRVLADANLGAAAARALLVGLGNINEMFYARQVLRRLAPAVTLALCLSSRLGFRWWRRFRLALPFRIREQQQLIGVETLRAAAEVLPHQPVELGFELLDLGQQLVVGVKQFGVEVLETLESAPCGSAAEMVDASCMKEN